MTDPSLLALLEEAYHVLQKSFVRFIVESSEPDVHDDLDRKAFSLFEDWSRESRYSQMAVGDVLGAEIVVPVSTALPLEYSQFNYLCAAYLLRPVIERSVEEEEQLGGLRKGLAAWPRAHDVLGAVLSRHRYYLDRARKLVAEHAEAPPTPAKIKGTSASRW